MQETEWRITQNYWDYQEGNVLFTYDAKEQEEIKLAKKIYEQEVWKLEFFTFYQIQIENGMTESQAILYNFIEWYTKTNRDFFYSNETISEKLKWGKDKINNIIKELEKGWYILVKKRIRAWGWLNRFIKTTWKGNPDLLIRKIRFWEIGKSDFVNSGNQTEVIYNNNIKYNSINNTTEQSSEIQNQSSNQTWNQTYPNYSLVELKEKEKSSAKKEKESMKEITLEINDLIWKLKDICNQYWVAYDSTKDRMFAKHILTAKDYWEFCEKNNQDRVTFACNVLLASIKINYWKGALSWPMKIYQNYPDLYNQTKQKAAKTYTPTIQVL